MKIEYDKWGTKNIICDNWGEFFREFKNWHAKNKGVIPPEHYNEKEFDHYVGWEGESFGDFWPRNEKGETQVSFTPEHYANNARVWAVETVLGNFHKIGRPVNELAVLVLNLHGSKTRYNDWIKQEVRASKVLREIWTTGETKNYQGLDLNWPVNTNQPNFSVSSPPSKEPKNSLWIGGIVTLIPLSLLVFTIFLKKLKWL